MLKNRWLLCIEMRSRPHNTNRSTAGCGDDRYCLALKVASTRLLTWQSLYLHGKLWCKQAMLASFCLGTRDMCFVRGLFAVDVLSWTTKTWFYSSLTSPCNHKNARFMLVDKCRVLLQGSKPRTLQRSALGGIWIASCSFPAGVYIIVRTWTMNTLPSLLVLL